MLNRILLSALLASLCSISSCIAEEYTGDKSLLWRISGNGLSNSSYLFGTIHLLCPGDYLWTDAMKKSLASCDKVCFEMDLDDPSVMSAASNGIMNESGKKLSEYFTDVQYKKVQSFFKDSLQTDLSQLQMMKPVMIETLLMAKSVDCLIPISYEANIMEEALRAKKEITGLESAEDQISLLNGIPDDSAAAEIVQMTDSFSIAKAEYAAMLAAYKQQDLPALFAIVQNGSIAGDDPAALLDDRNKKWIPLIGQKMKVSTVFFAVGAAHLYGKTGVIALLRREGYSVTPVR